MEERGRNTKRFVPASEWASASVLPPFLPSRCEGAGTADGENARVRKCMPGGRVGRRTKSEVRKETSLTPVAKRRFETSRSGCSSPFLTTAEPTPSALDDDRSSQGSVRAASVQLARCPCPSASVHSVCLRSVQYAKRESDSGRIKKREWGVEWK